ncbi:hypothetical protein Ga0080574_TMP2540 [Salipiger abyssi]|uniref:Uncharacterized protein n=1 Tax=Salipiger abyssi TaxID=1250539 RepID=A0A1P8UTY8_9RHOB|nr:hypothetical protein Ga0080574_TMP2540 [Salipiger abyssi]
MATAVVVMTSAVSMMMPRRVMRSARTMVAKRPAPPKWRIPEPAGQFYESKEHPIPLKPTIQRHDCATIGGEFSGNGGFIPKMAANRKQSLTLFRNNRPKTAINQFREKQAHHESI